MTETFYIFLGEYDEHEFKFTITVNEELGKWSAYTSSNGLNLSVDGEGDWEEVLREELLECLDSE